MTERHDAGGRVDELRRHLKNLGYLDAGVDRFVLGPAQSTRAPVLIAMFASTRIGFIAGILLGPAAAIGIGARVPGLVTSVRDAVVLAMYMGVLFGAAVAIAAFAASTLFASFARSLPGRRARLLARGAGTFVWLASLVYLTLWWRAANTGPDWSAPVWTAFALLVAVAISILLGHAVSVTALAVVMARSPAATHVDAASLFSWKAALGGGALAFAGAATLLVLTAPAETRETTSVPVLTVVPSGLRVRAIAIDGLDTAVFEDLSKNGELPALTAAFDVARVRLADEHSSDPARAWTTLATGQPPDAHGVYGLETRRLTGVQGSVPLAARSRMVQVIQSASDLLRLTRPSLASGEERRVKTLWEVAADSGLRTLVVNWWATWPAPAQSTATILSDRAALRLELGGTLDAEIAPPALYDRLRQEWAGIKRTATRRAAWLTASGDDAIADVVRKAGELDALQLTLAEHVGGGDPDLLAVYLPGLDIAQHTLFGEGGQLAPSAAAARLDALRDYYRFLDRLLGDVLVPSQSELVFVITGPGRIGDRGPGWLWVRGRAARHIRMDARGTDVAPTILYALGLPHSRELAGRPLIEMFVDDHVARYPVRETVTYGRPSAATGPRSGQPLDEEMIERLRSLGYVR